MLAEDLGAGATDAAEQHAVTSVSTMPAIAIQSPEFLSGQSILPYEEDSRGYLVVTPPRLKVPANSRPRGPSIASETAGDRVEEHARRLASVNLDATDAFEPKSRMDEEKRVIRRQIISRCNIKGFGTERQQRISILIRTSWAIQARVSDIPCGINI